MELFQTRIDKLCIINLCHFKILLIKIALSTIESILLLVIVEKVYIYIIDLFRILSTFFNANDLVLDLLTRKACIVSASGLSLL